MILMTAVCGLRPSEIASSRLIPFWFASFSRLRDGDNNKKKGKGGEQKYVHGIRGGCAMEEGFYQRDEAVEYETLDYDVNKQFDNEDVNMGEDDTGAVMAGSAIWTAEPASQAE